MQLKGVLFLLLVSSLLIGSVCAAGVNDFKVNDSYKSIYGGEYYSAYADGNQDAGICIFKNVDDDVYDDIENDDVLDNAINHDGREYIYGSDDIAIDKNSDNIANFTDYDHAAHGYSELVKQGGEEYIVAFWAKDSGNVDLKELRSLLDDFNKKNDLEPIAF